MNTFQELVNEMVEDMCDQVAKAESFSKIMFQWLHRISYDIDPESLNPDNLLEIDSDSCSLSDSQNEISQLISSIDKSRGLIKEPSIESFSAPIDNTVNIKNNDENSAKLQNVKDLNSSKKLFTHNTFVENQNTSTPKEKQFYFGMSEYADELSSNAAKFRQKWLESIGQKQ